MAGGWLLWKREKFPLGRLSVCFSQCLETLYYCRNLKMLPIQCGILLQVFFFSESGQVQFKSECFEVISVVIKQYIAIVLSAFNIVYSHFFKKKIVYVSIQIHIKIESSPHDFNWNWNFCH